jgi:hypothetical protein
LRCDPLPPETSVKPASRRSLTNSRIFLGMLSAHYIRWPG